VLGVDVIVCRIENLSIDLASHPVAAKVLETNGSVRRTRRS
jgi:hypothetical protein